MASTPANYLALKNLCRALFIAGRLAAFHQRARAREIADAHDIRLRIAVYRSFDRMRVR